MGSAKDKHRVRERFANDFLFATNGRLHTNEFRSTAMYIYILSGNQTWLAGEPTI
jgi:hypothetical protein